jgi:hypothetical protein
MSLIIPANTLASGGYAVDNSCRFDGVDSYLNITSGSSPTSTQKFTGSFWLKRSELGREQHIFGGVVATPCYFVSDDRLRFADTTSGTNYYTTQKFRDVSAWYHIVIAVDTTLGTAGDRARIYVNGSEITAFDTETNATQNNNTAYNIGSTTYVIGRYNPSQAQNYYYSGYMAEYVFIDGQQLDPTSFGEFDEDSGIWKPKSVSGLTFGTNGFYLDFEDSAALGDDVSGNGNDWTVNNLTAIDQTTDTPTNNFATGNPLAKNTNVVLSEGNLKITNASGGDSYAGGTFGLDVGKWYWENRKNGTGNTSVGIVLSTADISTSSTVTAKRVIYNANGEVYKEGAGGGSTTTGYTYADGDIIGIALDRENGTIKFYKNGTLVNTTTDSALSSSDNTWIPLWSIDSGGEFEANFGNPTFTISSGNTDGNDYGNFEYAVPSGYLSLCTANLSEVLG